MLDQQQVPIAELQAACSAALEQLGYAKEESRLITEVTALWNATTMIHAL